MIKIDIQSEDWSWLWCQKWNHPSTISFLSNFTLLFL